MVQKHLISSNSVIVLYTFHKVKSYLLHLNFTSFEYKRTHNYILMKVVLQHIGNIAV